MKKLLQLVFIFSATTGFAQSILVTKVANSQSVAANGTVYIGVMAGNSVSVLFDVKNTSVATETYIAYRYNAILNAGAAAYYCFAGSCYGDTAPISNTLVLNPGQSASQITGQFIMLGADLDEGPVGGLSHIKYSIKNMNTPADSIQINLRYNDVAMTVKELSNVFSQIEVSPNPASDKLSLSFDHKGIDNCSVSTINILGQAVSSKDQELSNGKNTILLKVNELPKGIYFVRLKTNDHSATKRIVVN